VRTELSLAELEAEMVACDVAVSLRWPTAGEMSATLMRAFGAGRPAVVTDVLQFRELDERFCWRVPVGEGEVARLVEVLSAAAADPERCAAAGRLARRFVEAEATYAVVGEQYVAHLEHCARHRGEKVAAVAPVGLTANAVLGVAVLEAYPPDGDGHDALAATTTALRRAGVDVVDLPPPPGAHGVIERLPPPRVVLSERQLAAARKSARRGRRPPPGGEPPRRPKPSSFQLVGRSRATAVEVGGLHEVVLCHADARRAAVLGAALREHHRRGRRTVAMITPDGLPPARAFDRVLRHADEIWVPSRFAADVLAGTPLGPVVVVPVPLSVEPASAVGVERERGGPLRVVAVADAAGGLARANPLGAIEAFAAAFGGTASGGADRARVAELELVVRNLPPGPAGPALSAALERVGGSLVTVGGAAQARARVAGGDVLVSLHRTDAAGWWCATAMALGVPVVLVRRRTERPEAVAAGTVWRIDPTLAEVRRTVETLLTDGRRYREMASAINPYGDGAAAGRVVHGLAHTMGLTKVAPDPYSPLPVGRLPQR
jgi:hypothetical protein